MSTTDTSLSAPRAAADDSKTHEQLMAELRADQKRVIENWRKEFKPPEEWQLDIVQTYTSAPAPHRELAELKDDELLVSVIVVHGMRMLNTVNLEKAPSFKAFSTQLTLPMKKEQYPDPNTGGAAVIAAIVGAMVLVNPLTARGLEASVGYDPDLPVFRLHLGPPERIPLRKYVEMIEELKPDRLRVFEKWLCNRGFQALDALRADKVRRLAAKANDLMDQVSSLKLDAPAGNDE